uniref:Origin recognition complex subunit 1 n=1 Tax=Rhabditophanes sp. KR3021 TaxID=114890 RepID=A0AC35TLZ3_9BILA
MLSTKGGHQQRSALVKVLDKLHPSETPDKLVCREKEVALIKKFIRTAASINGESSAMYISGVPGTGKTASVLQAIKKLSSARRERFDFCYVNGMELAKPINVFSEIYQKLMKVDKIAPTKARAALNEMFKKKIASRKPIVILVDELDLLVTKTFDILYDIFNWTTCLKARVSVISIANALDLPERIASRRITSRIGTNRMCFQPYDHVQISKIIKHRVQHFECVNEKAIDLASRKVAALNGDLRKAMDIVRIAVEWAIQTNLKVVEAKLVSEVIKSTNSNVYQSFFKDLSYLEHLIMETIVQIQLAQAFDRDEGDNGKIVYSVSNDNFHVNSNGEVMVRKHLDADQNKDGFFIYRFNVTATDKGNPVKSSTAQIFLTLANTNDEKPRFLPTRLYQASISEDAQGGTPIIQVQAIDPDTDQITYLFVHNGEEVDKTDIFEIDKDNGLIKLRSDVTPAQLMLEYTNYYNLTIIAYDDGSCCEDINSVRHYQTAYVIISIEKSTINNKPEFPDCHKYSALAKLDEGVYKNGPIILRAEAMDKDSGPNGDIIYSLYYSRGESRKPFIIDSTTGDIRPAPHILFDRETKAVEEITVKASDKGERPLIGFCSFFVQINGNRLIFTRPSYEISLSRNVKPGHTVLITKAEDSNPLQNSRITYKLGSDATAGKGHSDDIEYMRILNSEVGEVTLVKRIPSTTSQFIFNIIATDNNLPDPKYIVANIIVNIHEHYQPAPKWQTSSECKESIEVQENVQINSILFKCLAVAGDGSNNPITYKMNNGLTKETNSNGKFREFMETKNGKTWMIIRNMENLDFEQTSQYTLTVTATDMKTQLGREKMFYLKLRDENDKVPRVEVDKFTGSIEEELTPSQYLEKNKGKAIVTVKAIDSDSDGPQNEIHYRILGGNDGSQGGRFFRIDEFTGEIFPETKFDRETNGFFVLDIEASDGMQSSLPGTEGPNRVIIKATILISDKNDNQPTWKSEKHMAHVAENAEIGTEILTMTCEDVDSNSSLKYMIYDKDGSKKRIDFGINSATGSLFVKENLDYETKKSYNLMVMCTDGRFNSSTALEIIIDNIRDIKPLFDKPFYEITINEEDKRVPRKLLKVKAISEDSKIVYKLEGQVDDLFRVDRESGLIEVLKPLDRDGPFGVAVYNFIVSATDDNGKGLISFADVIVRLNDINDNAPFLAKDLMGTVIENRDPGSNGIYVLTAHATDNDDPKTDNAKIEYRISRNKEIDGEPVFRIDENSGKIFAMKKFDRELPSEKHFTIEVLATDKGSPAKKGSANITINILDVNDNAVYFKKDLYEVTVPEDAKIGSAVFTVAPEDEDNEAM